MLDLTTIFATKGFLRVRVAMRGLPDLCVDHDTRRLKEGLTTVGSVLTVDPLFPPRPQVYLAAREKLCGIVEAWLGLTRIREERTTPNMTGFGAIWCVLNHHRDAALERASIHAMLVDGGLVQIDYIVDADGIVSIGVVPRALAGTHRPTPH